jgi:sugar/nucleoside kinase (ribokinase family)
VADILVIGDVMTDVVVLPAGAVRRGSDQAASIRLLPGGSGANLVAWIGSLGGSVAMIGRVGSADAAAHAAALRAHEVVPVLAVDSERPSGVLVALVSADGERSFLTDRGANAALGRDDLPDAMLEGASLLHVSGYALFAPGPRAAVLDYAANASARGVPWTVDAASAGFLADAGPAAFLDWTEGADTLVANADEAAVLAGTDEPRQQLATLRAHYRCVVLKRGAEGCHAVERGSPSCWVPAPAIAAVDTTGAGDAFLAGYLLAHLTGLALPDCLAAGVEAGARAVTTLGGRPAAG